MLDMPKNQLVEMMPLLADMIVTNESDIKELLKQIFHEISKEV